MDHCNIIVFNTLCVGGLVKKHYPRGNYYLGTKGNLQTGATCASNCLGFSQRLDPTNAELLC